MWSRSDKGTMKFHSTRGTVAGVSFKDMLLSGYASDGGMFLPEQIPKLSQDTLAAWSKLSFQDLAFEVLSLFIDREDIPADDLKGILQKCYVTFDTPEVVPFKRLSSGLLVAELFHGKSLAFKDLSLTIVGQLYDYFLARDNSYQTLLVATSGDTGSSAIEAVRGKKQIDIIVMLPRDRCTKIQERQMTTVLDPNVHVYRVDGSSDDIDIIVRQLCGNKDFVAKHHLGSPSSLNFTRLIGQLVHMFYTYFKVCPNADEEVEIICPTGGGGNVTAGVIAREMGLPVKFVCAVNHNNILSRMMETGQCDLGPVEVTIAPAMDIQFAYNLERVWYICSDGDSSIIRNIMDRVDQEKVQVPMPTMEKMKSMIQAYTVPGRKDILATIKKCWDEDEYNICPHTAIGFAAYNARGENENKTKNGVAVLATASPLKFPEAIKDAGVPAPTSEGIQKVLSDPTSYTDLEKGQDWLAIIRAKIEEITANRLNKS